MNGSTTLEIECGKEKKELTIRNNCNAERVAFDFCKNNDLDFASMQLLTSRIKQVQAKNRKVTVKDKKTTNTSVNVKSADEEEKKIKRTKMNKVNYSAMLYQKGKKFKSKVNNEVKCSFRPHINPISFSVLYKRMTSHTECNNEDKIINYKRVKNKQLNELKNKHKTNLSEEKYSFRPKINKNSSQIDKELQIKTTVSSARYDKLYNDRKRISNNIKKLANKVYDKEILFKPQINKNVSGCISSMNFTQRQHYYQSKSKQKEFGIAKSEYPRFRTNSDDLDFQSIFSIIEYAQNLLSDSGDQNLSENISLAASYFDAALNYDEKQQYSNEYLLFGASAEQVVLWSCP